MINKLANQGSDVMDKLRRSKKRIEFGTKAREYIQDHPEFKSSTVAQYNSFLKVHLSELDHVNIQDVTSEVLQKFQARLQRTNATKGSKPLSPRRVNSIMSFLKTVLKQQFRNEHLKLDVAATVKPLKEDKANIDPLSQDELMPVLRTVDPHYRTYFTTLALTGARPNELHALRWSDIDWHGEYIDITKGRVRGVEGKPRTQAGNRKIPLNPELITLLKELKGRSVNSINGYVFTRPNGQPIDKHMDKVWSRGLRKAGLRHRPAYQLRHTFASHAVDNGVPLQHLAKVLGHSTIESLVRNYAGVIQAHNWRMTKR